MSSDSRSDASHNGILLLLASHIGVHIDDIWLYVICMDAPSLLIVLAVLTARSFYQQRKAVNEFLDSNGSLSHGHYRRLILLSCVDVILTIPIGIYGCIIFLVDNNVSWSYPGWDFVHADFSEIFVLTTSDWQSNILDNISVRWNQWICPVCALIFFSFFGLTNEMRQRYKSFFWKAMHCAERKELPTTAVPYLAEGRWSVRR